MGRALSNPAARIDLGRTMCAFACLEPATALTTMFLQDRT